MTAILRFFTGICLFMFFLGASAFTILPKMYRSAVDLGIAKEKKKLSALTEDYKRVIADKRALIAENDTLYQINEYLNEQLYVETENSKRLESLNEQYVVHIQGLKDHLTEYEGKVNYLSNTNKVLSASKDSLELLVDIRTEKIRELGNENEHLEYVAARAINAEHRELIIQLLFVLFVLVYQLVQLYKRLRKKAEKSNDQRKILPDKRSKAA